MDKGKLSVASVAVDVAKDVFDTFADKTVLVVGAGKMGDLTLQHLVDAPPRLDPGHQPQPRAGRGRRDPLGRQGRPVRSTRSGPWSRPTWWSAPPPPTGRSSDLGTYARVQKARKNRLSLILDIAIPRDFDPRIGDLEHVYALQRRRPPIPGRAEPPASAKRGRPGPGDHRARDRDSCLASLQHRTHAGAVLRQLGDYADATRAPRIRGPDRSPSRVDPSLQKDDIAHAFQRLQNQFLHHPRAALRTAASAEATEQPHSLLNAVKALFGLDNG